MLSKGERQNVLIARAMMTDPDILVLDEPGTGLDVVAREMLLRKISEMAEGSRKTIIYVTHYPEEILPIFDHGIILSHGRIVDRGSVQRDHVNGATEQVVADAAECWAYG